MVKYMYDAWGVCDTIVLDESATDIANLNPFRYRSYYLDTGLNLYYLKTRYYDPEICRFITIDDLAYLDADSINGLNLYAYCKNNPVSFYDPTGCFPWLGLLAIGLLFTPIGGMITQATITATSYVGIKIASLFDETIKQDMDRIGNDIFNADELLVSESQKVSFYKGVPVFRTDGSSASFGIILLTRAGFTGKSGHYWTPEDILKHEWGHSVQQLTFGPIPYLVNIGIPSAFIDNHDNAPWEITADVLGGVNREYNKEEIEKGWQYFWKGRIVGPFWWWLN